MCGNEIQFEALPLSARQAIDAICTRFEDELKSGATPSLESCLRQLDQQFRASLFRELLVLELSYRSKEWREIWSDYQTRFVEYRDIVASVFDMSHPAAETSRGIESTHLWPIADEAAPGSTSRAAPGETRTTDGSTASMKTIGRYRIVRIIGEGAFGTVYEADDKRLHRSVAIKVPQGDHQSRVPHSTDLVEARTLASLDHPNIVPIYDVQRTDDGRYYVVSKLIEGCDLRETLKQSYPTFTRSAEIVAYAGEAVHYAHTRGIIHRDIKPANILIERTGKIYVADFGLALNAVEITPRPGIVGTPTYMSPEQARGENHLVGPQSDVFSLGAVLYQLLTRQVPFFGKDLESILSQVRQSRMVTLRQHNDRIPRQLEWICMKAMSPRAVDRYATASEMAQDLRSFLASQLDAIGENDSAPNIVPRGLRSYDREDERSFLQLLPGPRDQAGLPAIIRQLKSHLEELSSSATFRVGIVYGPSGCGKTSLIKAGLLPRLSENIVSLCVEATPANTESDLLTGIRERLSRADPDLTLCELARSIRIKQILPAGQKLVLIIDQFEQWLYQRRSEDTMDLVQTLRQCDGGVVQCLLLVRDDFWSAATRFMTELDEPIIEQTNAYSVDLFDMDHAKKVLTQFGIAYERLPEESSELSRTQKSFVNEAVAAMSDSGKVIPIRLAIFAEMMRHQEWNLAALRRIGGAMGVGVAFLDESFANNNAPQEYRKHLKAVRAVLEILLPDTGQKIKGHSRSYQQLHEASGYRNQREFDQLLQILTNDTRLLSAVQSSVGAPSETPPSAEPESKLAYQLTHDYLVPAIREWLNRDRRNSRRGRAELRLVERAELWYHSNRAPKQLPSLLEWLNIELFTSSFRRTASQRELMRVARASHGLRLAFGFVIVIALAFVSVQMNGRARSRYLVNALKTSETTDVVQVLHQLRNYQQWATPLLEHVLAESTSTKEQLHARLALARSKPEHLQQIVTILLDSADVELTALLTVRKELQVLLDDATKGHVWVNDESTTSHRRFRAACLWPDAEDWTDESKAIVVGQLLAVCEQFPGVTSHLIEMFHADRLLLEPALRHAFHRNTPLRKQAAEILASFHHQESSYLVELLLDATPEQLPYLLEPIDLHHAQIVRTQLLQALTLKKTDLKPSQHANVVLTLFHLGASEHFWELLSQEKDPSAKHHLINAFGRAEIDPTPLLKRFIRESEPPVIASILQILGGYSERSARYQIFDSTTIDSIRHYASEVSDPGIHAAAQWLLRIWGYEVKLEPHDRFANVGGKNSWYVSSSGHAMVVMETNQSKNNLRGQSEDFLSRRFAIGMYEVTNDDFDEFVEGFSGPRSADPYDCAAPHCPAARVSWHEAAAFCNWLSDQEGLEPCYESGGNRQFISKQNSLSKSGYRLPTVEEWEFACSANSETKWFFGKTDDLYGEFAWFSENTGDLKKRRVGLKKPNGFGLFDVYGNATEWCHTLSNPNQGYRALRGGAAGDPVRTWTRFEEEGDPKAVVPAIGFRIARTCAHHGS